ncbi:MAG: 3-phosphoshikimate 1-carboxyvinyltransferase [Candidatus Metalachnospira sp.]|nr:3-phosphoshikimate 1-carboxyvinyltransferase [Candidatus Metalachnospira sp.]
MNKLIKPAKCLRGKISVPGDKSISHRSVMLGSIAKGTTHVYGFLTGADCLSTISCFKKLGIDIKVEGTDVTVHGKGLHGLTEPSETLDVGNSGTTLRLMSGLLSAQPFPCHITGDSSIQKRPMGRVADPIKLMGGKLISDADGDKLTAPLAVEGTRLNAIDYILPVASAQVKSAVILAGMYADGETRITEPEATRDHTEIMLNYLGADIKKDGNTIIVNPVEELTAKDIYVPGDISSAAYFIAAALICPNSEITIENVGVNPTRTGIIDAFLDMGADIKLTNERTVCGEKVADIVARTSSLHGAVIKGDIIPKLIDEIPVIAVVACFADGDTIIADAQELKVKESNRIKTTATEINRMGGSITETDDGMIIKGSTKLHGAVCESYDDHRIAMSTAVAALVADGETEIINAECSNISFPNFYDLFDLLRKD